MSEEPKSQSKRFKEIARELECDEDKDRFNETLKRIAPKSPDPGRDRGSDP